MVAYGCVFLFNQINIIAVENHVYVFVVRLITTQIVTELCDFDNANFIQYFMGFIHLIYQNTQEYSRIQMQNFNLFKKYRKNQFKPFQIDYLKQKKSIITVQTLFKHQTLSTIMRQNLTGVPLTVSTIGGYPYAKKNVDHIKARYHSYQNINEKSNSRTKQSQNNLNLKIQNHLFKQLEAEYENISNYQISKYKIDQKNDNHLLSKNNSTLQIRNHSQLQRKNQNKFQRKNDNQFQNINNNTFEQIYDNTFQIANDNTFQVANENISYRQNEKSKKPTAKFTQPYPNKNQQIQIKMKPRNKNNIHQVRQDLQRQLEPQMFRNIQGSDTLQNDEDLQLESPTKAKNNLQLSRNNFRKQKKQNYSKKQVENKYGRYSTVQPQQVQQNHGQLGFNNFRNQTYSQNQFYSKMTKNQKLSVKADYLKNFSSNNTSGKSESTHPVVFRDTLEYIDEGKFDFSGKITQYSQNSKRISAQSSDSDGPRTNIDVSKTYRFKYKKYKTKYLNLMSVIHQLENLNETLIKDQRQNYNYYENTIRSLENLLMIKDKQIQELNDILLSNQNDMRNQNITSIEGRQYQIEYQKLKKQLALKNNQIKNLKQNISTMDESFHATQKSTSNQNKHMEKRVDLLKIQKQSLLKKNKALEQINGMYEQKLKDKQNRVSKISAFNSELQEEILKFKQKIHVQETNDTERSFGMTFLRKQNKDHLQYTGQTSKDTLRQGKRLQIEKHLECINEQIQLIRNRIGCAKESKHQQQQRRNSIQQLGLISEFELSESIKQTKDQKYIKQLQTMAEKLQSFRKSMDIYI